MITTKSDLNYFTFWWLCGWLLVISIVYLSLMSVPPKVIVFSSSDKFAHLIAYGVLMFWFAQLYVSRRLQMRIALGFTTLGVGLEVLQGMSGYRYFEYADMLANVLGVVLGWWFSSTVFVNSFTKIEKLFQKAVQ